MVEVTVGEHERVGVLLAGDLAHLLHNGVGEAGRAGVHQDPATASPGSAVIAHEEDAHGQAPAKEGQVELVDVGRELGESGLGLGHARSPRIS
jgi:hypothetical protein